MRQQDGTLTVKTPLEVLMDLKDPRAKDIDERELGLYEAFDMEFNTLDPPKDLSLMFVLCFLTST